MWSNIERYKDPHMVAEIQRWFGIEIQNDASKEYKSNGAVSKKIGVVPNGYSQKDDTSNSENLKEQPSFTIHNHFWYYLFRFGTELGDELFYISFITFWFWNIDAVSGRRIILLWSIIMTVGQMLKDIIRWPRPACPPAVKLQNKWSVEYGMPSTHAMISVAIPFSTVIFTMNRFIYFVPAAWIVAILWSMLISVSRIYLGMHTVLDIIVGLFLAFFMLVTLVPLVDAVDYCIYSNFFFLLTFLILSILVLVYYPTSDKWTPTRNDTAYVVSVITGVYVGTFMNYKTGIMVASTDSPPFEIFFPSSSAITSMILRTVLGLCFVLVTKPICKALSYTTLSAMMRINSAELMQSKNCVENKPKILVDLVYKYLTCFMIGFNTLFLIPIVFHTIGIDRPHFYTEL